MFKRKLTDNLTEWAGKSNRKPLILRGARQTGKTTLINDFARNFDQYLYFNLENVSEKQLFDRDLPFEDYLSSIFLYKNLSLGNKKILIFIDEIQNSANAVKQLRYFYEKRPELYVVAAGSLLETLLEKHITFPVGRVEFLFLHPFSFEEFLWATEENLTAALYGELPIKEYGHQKLINLFHRYTLIGGMPEAVKTYVSSSNDIVKTNQIHSALIATFLEDIEKYARDNKTANIIRHAINTIPYEAGKRIKYAGFGKSNYSSREISEVMLILEKTMLITFLRPTTSVELPAIPDMKKSPKLQFLDTGIINHINGLQQSIINVPDLNSVYKGIITEHICAQEIISLNVLEPAKPMFWVREKKQSNAEVDFVIPYKDLIIPIEIKSGKEGTLRSLHQFINNCKHSFAVRMYNGILKIDSLKTPEGKPYRLLSIPYYLSGRINKYIEWFVENQ
ncbi:MAG: ATP-binding protein [Spirochaetales bacterium]|nr:ATP-binding protein [Spirochaetales bacterium]